MKNSLYLSCILLLSLYNLSAQTYNRKGIFLDANFSLGYAVGQLSDRFGIHQSVGGGIGYHTAFKLDFGIKAQYFFGNKVKEDVLKPYRTDFHQLIGIDGFLTDVTLKERGFNSYVYIGYLFPIASQKRFQHGIKLNLGIGWLEHKIRLQDDSRSTPYIYATDFGKGLDRLTNGICTSIFLGYEFKSMNGKINFFTGVESLIGFTQNKRAWNYDLANSSLGIERKDIFIQYKIGWYLPIFLDKNAELIEY